MFCNKCGKELNNEAVVCVGCGCAVNVSKTEKDNRGLITILLCWFLGIFGAHRFYTGHTTIGIIQILTLGGCGIWVLIDFIIILMGDFKDAEGNAIKISM
jgi:TM2 domain-containing membrane protein YozV